jgi:flagellar hook-length control protein FliK
MATIVAMASSPAPSEAPATSNTAAASAPAAADAAQASGEGSFHSVLTQEVSKKVEASAPSPGAASAPVTARGPKSDTGASDGKPTRAVEPPSPTDIAAAVALQAAAGTFVEGALATSTGPGDAPLADGASGPDAGSPPRLTLALGATVPNAAITQFTGSGSADSRRAAHDNAPSDDGRGASTSASAPPSPATLTAGPGDASSPPTAAPGAAALAALAVNPTAIPVDSKSAVAPASAPTTAQAIGSFQNLIAALPGSPASGAPAASATLAAPVGSSQWTGEVGNRVVYMIQQNLQSASLQLNPQHLGPLDVHIRMDAQQTSIAFSAVSPETRHALEASLPQLREMLAGRGLSLGDCSVGAGPSGQSLADGAARFGSGGPSGGSSRETPDGVARPAGASDTRVITHSLQLVDTFA